MASIIASISRRPAPGAAFRWFACTPPAPTDGSTGTCWPIPEITSRFRVLAFDMPWHGKSTPPDGWEKTEYRLTTASYTAAIRAFCQAMELDRPVVMGCSIGGRIVLNLAIAHAAEFRALIALEAADFQQPWYDTAWLHRPDVHGGEVCAALVSGLIAPQSPPVNRHETLWMYMQGGPGVFKGDLYFYRVDGDLREKVKSIDTKVCPLYLLTGEYDFSCTSEDTLRTAAQIPGVEVQIMKHVGHFPMSEHPAKFREYILPVLEKISCAYWTALLRRREATSRDRAACHARPRFETPRFACAPRMSWRSGEYGLQHLEHVVDRAGRIATAGGD